LALIFFVKQLTLRKKSNCFWCTIYCKKLSKNIWSIGLVVNKSKRASNDWYAQRMNKRKKRVINERIYKSLKQLRVCFTLIKKAIKVLPNDANFIIHNDFREAQALSKYVERLGFMPIYLRGSVYWVLTIPKKAEVLLRS
jgi:aldehyde:ferredoxin oxidoreductase